MSVTVTIHSGELKQIKRLIEVEKKKKPTRGELYGLWTHSNQPVIQYVTGDLKGEGNVSRLLWESHGLRLVGSWSTEEFEDDGTCNGKSPPSFVNMAVGLLENGKIMNVKLSVFEKEAKLNGALETLEGQSAFRLTSPFTDQRVQKQYHAPPDDDDLDVRDLSPKPSCQAETRKDQWYSTEEGMQLFGKIHGAFKEEQFEITGTSRDTTTHDICVTFKFQEREFAVDFPRNFPHDLATLSSAGHRKKEIRLTEESSEGRMPNGSKVKTSSTAKKGKKKAKDAEPQEPNDHEETPQEQLDPRNKPQEQLDPEKIPQLLVQGIRHQMSGTKV